MRNRFWHLDRTESKVKRAEWAQGEVDLASIVCPVNRLHRRSGKRLSNLSVLLPKGDVEDFVWTWYSELLVQEYTLDLFQEWGLTGYETRPVKARFKDSSVISPPPLWELVVTGWGGVAPPESGIHPLEERSCTACRLWRFSAFTDPSRLIDERQWDGSDFFIVWPMPVFIMVTDRVAEMIRDRKVKGVQLVPIEELQATNTMGILGASPLSYYMPDSRARELGEPLGIY